MTRQDINIGASANDGTGDTLRSAGSKINSNFRELYVQFGGESSSLSTLITIKDSDGTGAIIFEGTSTDDFETKLMAANPTDASNQRFECRLLANSPTFSSFNFPVFSICLLKCGGGSICVEANPHTKLSIKVQCTPTMSFLMGSWFFSAKPTRFL